MVNLMMAATRRSLRTVHPRMINMEPLHRNIKVMGAMSNTEELPMDSSPHPTTSPHHRVQEWIHIRRVVMATLPNTSIPQVLDMMGRLQGQALMQIPGTRANLDRKEGRGD